MTVAELKQLIASLQQQASMEQADIKAAKNGEANQPLAQLQTDLNNMSSYFNELISGDKAYTNQENKEVLNHISKIRNDMEALGETVSDQFKTAFGKEFTNLEVTAASLDPTKNQKFVSCLDQTELIVTLNNNEAPDFMGNVSSKRFMLNVNGQEGFFTIDSDLMVYDNDGKIRKMIEDRIKDAKIDERELPAPKEERAAAAGAGNMQNNDDFDESFVPDEDNDSFNFSENGDEPQAQKETLVEDKAMKDFGNMLLQENHLSDFLMCLKLREEASVGADKDFVYVDDAFNFARMEESGLTLGENNPYPGTKALLTDNQNIKKLLLDIRNAIPEEEASQIRAHRTQFHEKANDSIRAEQGSSVTGRSIATSRVNNLLGVPDISARSTPMTVQWNGQTYHGMFMEKAKGYSLPSPEKCAGSPMYRALYDENGLKADKPFQTEGLKTVADQTIVDYICQNVDRHQDNMLYNFDENGKFTGIQGIDNDLSFGTRKVDDEEQLQNSVALNNITAISASMKDQVEKLNKETLKGALKDTGLTEKEIEAAGERLEHLKEHIRNNLLTAEPQEGEAKLQHGKIRVIEDGKWSEYKPSDFHKTEYYDKDKDFSLFYNLTIVKDNLAYAHNNARSYNPGEEERQVINTKTFKETTERSELSSARLKAKQDEYKALRAEFKKTEKYHGSKKQYDTMQEALKTMISYDHSKELTADQMLQYNRDLMKLEQAVDNYISYKEALHQTKPVAVKRLSLANALKAKLEEHKEFYQDALKNAEEHYLEHAHEEYIKERKDINMNKVVDTITAKISAMDRHRKADKDIVRVFVKKTDVLQDMLKSMNNDDVALADMAQSNPDKLFEQYKTMLKNRPDPAKSIDLDTRSFKTKSALKAEIKAKNRAKELAAKEERKAAERKAKEERKAAKDAKKLADKAEKDAKKAGKTTKTNKTDKKVVKNPKIEAPHL